MRIVRPQDNGEASRVAKEGEEPSGHRLRGRTADDLHPHPTAEATDARQDVLRLALHRVELQNPKRTAEQLCAGVRRRHLGTSFTSTEITTATPSFNISPQAGPPEVALYHLVPGGRPAFHCGIPEGFAP